MSTRCDLFFFPLARLLQAIRSNDQQTRRRVARSTSRCTNSRIRSPPPKSKGYLPGNRIACTVSGYEANNHRCSTGQHSQRIVLSLFIPSSVPPPNPDNSVCPWLHPLGSAPFTRFQRACITNSSRGLVTRTTEQRPVSYLSTKGSVRAFHRGYTISLSRDVDSYHGLLRRHRKPTLTCKQSR